MSTFEDVLAAAAELESLFRGEGWRFCFIGGIAVQRWGMPRFTQDVDATLLPDMGGEARFVDLLLEKYRGRRPDARQLALNNRMVLASTPAASHSISRLAHFPMKSRRLTGP